MLYVIPYSHTISYCFYMILWEYLEEVNEKNQGTFLAHFHKSASLFVKSLMTTLLVVSELNPFLIVGNVLIHYNFLFSYTKIKMLHLLPSGKMYTPDGQDKFIFRFNTKIIVI